MGALNHSDGQEEDRKKKVSLDTQCPCLILFKTGFGRNRVLHAHGATRFRVADRWVGGGKLPAGGTSMKPG